MVVPDSKGPSQPDRREGVVYAEASVRREERAQLSVDTDRRRQVNLGSGPAPLRSTVTVGTDDMERPCFYKGKVGEIG